MSCNSCKHQTVSDYHRLVCKKDKPAVGRWPGCEESRDKFRHSNGGKCPHFKKCKSNYGCRCSCHPVLLVPAVLLLLSLWVIFW